MVEAPRDKADDCCRPLPPTALGDQRPHTQARRHHRATSQRGGHIPGAAGIPWVTAVGGDGCYKSYTELQQIYGDKGITDDKEVIAYCRIGERSSHTWFALKYLLGYPNVRNYDGSWTEWGSVIGAPIEKSYAG